MAKKNIQINVLGKIITVDANDYISLTDMLKAKDGDFFISDWLRNRNTLEYLGIWERIHNPDFNYGEFAVIKSQSGLNSYKISVKEWTKKPKPSELMPKQVVMAVLMPIKILPLSLACGLVLSLKYISLKNSKD